MKKTHDDLIHNKLQGCYERKYALLKQCKICAKTKMSLLPKGTTSMLPVTVLTLYVSCICDYLLFMDFFCIK